MSFYTTVEERRFSAASDDFSYWFSPGAKPNATTGAEAHLYFIRNAALEGPLFHGGASSGTKGGGVNSGARDAVQNHRGNPAFTLVSACGPEPQAIPLPGLRSRWWE